MLDFSFFQNVMRYRTPFCFFLHVYVVYCVVWTYILGDCNESPVVTFSSFPSYHLPGDSSSSDESSDDKDIKATRPVKTTTSTERGERKRAGSKVIAVI